MKAPKKWKMAILIWIAIYPTITLLFITMGNEFARITFLPLRTFVITLIVVPLMVFVITPILQYVMAGWLKR
jgi:hypothetical protein